MRNFILSAFSALLLGFVAVGAQNTQPTDGTYYIVNSAPSPDGERLAATYQSNDPNVIVTPLTSSNTQQWSIVTVDGQFIIPVNNPSVATTGKDEDVIVSSENTVLWKITKTAAGDSYTIANQSQYWGLDSAVNNEKISLEAVTGDEKQNWVLELVEPSPGR